VTFTVKYHPAVRDQDIKKLDQKTKDRIRRAIETRLMTSPHEYGQPLRRTLKGYWKLRVGDYRVVFKINEGMILILGICHRKEIYDKIETRLS
jgi:mRNA interferase RelE/StbE